VAAQEGEFRAACNPEDDMRIPIWLKFAIPTTILLVALILLVGTQIAGRMESEALEQINQQGAALVVMLETATDPLIYDPEQRNERTIYREISKQDSARADETWEYDIQNAQVQWNESFRELAQSGEGAEILDIAIYPKADHRAFRTLSIAPRPVETAGSSRISSAEAEHLGVTVSGNDDVMVFTKTIQGASGPLAEAQIFVSTQPLKDIQWQVWSTAYSLAGVAAVIGLIGCLLVASFMTRPIKTLVKDLKVVEEGHLEHRTKVATKDEIGALAATFNEMVEGLQEREALAQQQLKVENELAVATQIQQNLLPKAIPEIPGFDIGAYYDSALQVSGDYYDFMELQADLHGIIVADVSGKGVPGSMVMTMARAMIRMASATSIDPVKTMQRSNAILHPDIKRGMFLTCMYGILDPEQKSFKIISAGHNPLYYYRARTDSMEEYNPNGMGLGIDSGKIFDRLLQEETVTFEPGDRAVLYTDGVNEAMNEAGEIYGDPRLLQFCQDNKDLTSAEFIDKLVLDIADHRGNAEQSDDITIVSIKAT
jgi:serine phosphatase RsbU (regulator of sigma subunit)